MPTAPRLCPAVSAALLLLATGCSKETPPAAAPPPPDVRVMPVVQRDTPLVAEYVGEVRGSEDVDVRARVGGILVSKRFRDGGTVRAGEVLFTIDDREYRAQLANARAQVEGARADLERAREDVARYEPLVKANAISRQIYDNAVAQARVAEARVEATQQAITQAQLGIEFTSVKSPAGGRIGEALLRPGEVVQAGSTLLAQVSRVDEVFVYFSVPEQQLLEFTRRFGATPSPEATANLRNVRLVLQDGREYGQAGAIDFGDRAIDPKTGSYTLRARFTNGDGLLVPGQYARIKLTTDTLPGALLVPDRAVIENLGSYFVTVVGADDKAELRPVTLGPRLGTTYVISAGVKAGERVVVEGVQKARPGLAVKATPITEQELIAPPVPPVARPATAPAGGEK